MYLNVMYLRKSTSRRTKFTKYHHEAKPLVRKTGRIANHSHFIYLISIVHVVIVTI